MNNLKQTLEKTLKTEPLFCDSESGELNYIKIKDSADKIDERLIALLADHQDLKEQFFTKIRDVYVFNIKDFKFFLDESRVDNSYTKYANRIGLADNSGLLENRSEVVLDFPFKDCLLQGGQRVEEGTDTYFEYSKTAEKYEQKTAKRKEIFFNQALARDEIDRLLDRKALIHWRRFAADGTKDGEPVTEIKRDKTGLIQENLIIKGNNLLALHSLKYEFAGKVKLIYIDPPYNTDSAANTFNYNNSFNHSTWLTFMKNRLEVAREFLRDDGIIIIDIDHFELFYLGVLCDEIFGKDNRLGILAVQHNPGGRDNEFFANSHENKLVYGKNKLLSRIYSFELTKLEKDKYNKKDDIGKYKEIPLRRTGDNSGREARPNLYYPIYYNEETEEISIKSKKNFIEIWPVDNEGAEKTWRWSDDKIRREWKTEIVVKKINMEYKLYTKDRLTASSGRKPKTCWVNSKHAGTSGTKAIKDIFGGDKVFTYPKSPFLVADTLKIATKENDLVLDFFLGSGTTCAVAHKMGRQYIGIEQMDYIETVALERMKKVLQGDQGGISKEAQWRGGGHFIYCELAKWNEQAKEEIQNAQDLPALVTLFDTLYERYFLHYNIKTKEFKENIINEQQFKHLTLNEHKKMFLAMLDLNQMYVNESEMADKRYGIKPEDQKLTKDFYSKK